jgi:leucine dehydrogenase
LQQTETSVMQHADFDHHEEVVFHHDETSGLSAIIAIHNRNLGPSLGGCRMYPYASQEEALGDVLRLSRGMTYKSALAGLPLGGGKAVIIGNPRADKTRELFLAMGSFIDSLQGRYISAEDSGTSVTDLAVMGERTRWVSGIHAEQDFNGDPSPYTALGTFEGIKAALQHRLNLQTLSGISVAIQGVGNVGMHLTKLLTEAGARVYVSDVNEQSLAIATSLYGAVVVDPNKIHRLDVDVFSPCAMGGAISHKSIEEIRAPIIAGASNNQLASPELAGKLKQRNILYAPDYVINAGGIIDVHHQQSGNWDASSVRAQVISIGATLEQIFERADIENLATSVVADRIAEEIFLTPKPVSNAA